MRAEARRHGAKVQIVLDVIHVIEYLWDAAYVFHAEASKEALVGRQVLPGRVVVPIVTGQTFYAAEGYHQNFHVTNPGRYTSYRYGCGRDAKVKQVWAKDLAR